MAKAKKERKQKMKKIMIAVAIVCAAAVSHAAAFSWDGFDINDINGDAYTGTALLHCVELPTLSASGDIDAGELLGANLISDDFVVGNTYSFYFTSEDAAGNTYQSETVSAPALGVGTSPFSFEGNGVWTPAPEPTSGLLMLLGLAGLALRRKRV